MPTVGVVVPCYNEADRMPVADFLAYVDAHPSVSFCFVNDGSADATGRLLADARRGREERVHVVDLARNRGKAEAVRTGVLHALAWQRFEFVGYLDADLATPLAELEHFLTYEPPPERFAILCGSRWRRMGARIDRKLTRHLVGRAFASLASLVLRLPVYDTQCGAKLIRADVAAGVFDRPFVSRWLFDVEIFARTVLLLGRERAAAQILEVPLRAWTEKGASKIRLRDAIAVPLDLLRIHRRYRGR